MRIERLELTAFGPFTDAVLDFSAGAPGGLHLVLGPNEAGKSSALRGLISFLYGIEQRSKDTFVHKGPDLRLSATLTLSDGQRTHLTRRKGRGRTLHAPGGEELEDGFLLRELGGMARSDFVHAFGLGHGDLRRGAEILAGSEGVLSQVLFAAASSLKGFCAAVDGLGRETDALFSAQSRTKPMDKALAEYRELCAEARRLCVLPETFAALQARRAQFQDAREQAAARAAALAAERQGLDRMRQALGHVRRRAELLEDLARLGPSPLLSPDFRQRRIAAESALAQARSRIDHARKNLERLDIEIAAIPDSGQWTGSAGRIKALLQGLEHYREAVRDCPVVAAEAQQFRTEAESLLRRLRPDLPLERVEELRLTRGQQKNIRGLAQERHGLDERLAGAEREEAKLEDQVRRLREELDSLPPPADPALLAAALDAAAEHPGLEARTLEQDQALAALGAQTAVDLGRLGSHWRGDLAAAEALPVPPEEALDRFAEEWSRTARDLDQAGSAEEDLAGKIRGNRQERTLLATGGDLPSRSRVQEARDLRDRGWAAIRGRLDQRPDPEAEAEFMASYPDADRLSAAFEAALRQADEAADALQAKAGAAAKAEVLDSQHAGLLQESDAARTLREQAAAALDRCQAGWRDLWSAAGVLPGPPREMKNWLRIHAALVARCQTRRAKAAELAAGRELAAGLARNLAAALAGLDAPLPAGLGLAASVRHARNILERLEGQAGKRRDTQRELLQVQDRSRDKRAEKAAILASLEHWGQRWAEALRPLGLAPDTPPDRVLDQLQDLDDLLSAHTSLAERQDRVGQMEAAINGYAARARTLAGGLLPERADAPADELAAEFSVRLDTAQLNAQQRRDLAAQAEQERRSLEQAEDQVRSLDAQSQALCREARCSGADGLDAAERAADERRELESKLAPVEEILLNLSSGQDLEDFAATVRACDPVELDSRIARLDAEIGELSLRVSAVSEEVGSLDAEIRRMDGSALAAEKAAEAAQVLAGLQADAERFVLQRLAVSILKEEMERYRRTHQGPVLEQAGRIFSRLTRGSFQGVDVDYDDKGQPVLVAVRPGGSVLGRLKPEALSDGAADQLFMALRLAFVRHHLTRNPPLPLVLDDVLVHFDDARSRAALEEFGKVARATQVVFFTHHRHLADLAQEVLPRDILFTHHLSPSPAP